MWQSLRSLYDWQQYFDANERRLVIRSIVIGAAVWAIVYALKTAVHWLEHEVLHLLETQPILIAAPLLLLLLGGGALIVARLATHRAHVVHYRDGDGHLHQLIDVEGDGLERAISLYYASEPTFENALLGQEGVDVRWQLPTFSLAFRKFMATLATLGSGGSGGLEASVTLIGESVSAGLFKPRSRRASTWRGSSAGSIATSSAATRPRCCGSSRACPSTRCSV